MEIQQPLRCRCAAHIARRGRSDPGSRRLYIVAARVRRAASAIEGNDIDGLPDGLREAAMDHGVEQLLDEDLAPLDGLGIGVADSGAPALTARGSLDLTGCGLAVSPLAKC